MKRPRSTSAPTALVAFSLAICLGAAVDVNASQQSPRLRATTAFTAAEREALASLLACLSDAAKQIKPDVQTSHATLTPPRLAVAAVAEPSAVVEAVSPRGHDPLEPGTLTRAHLLNLPPPTR